MERERADGRERYDGKQKMVTFLPVDVKLDSGDLALFFPI